MAASGIALPGRWRNRQPCFAAFILTRGSVALDLTPGSEEKVAFVGFPFRPAMPAEANLLGIVSAEFVAEKLAVCCPPRLHLAVHDGQVLSAKCTAGRRVLPGRVFSRGVFPGETFTHLMSLTPFEKPHSS
jgi:hypothetical protein